MWNQIRNYVKSELNLENSHLAVHLHLLNKVAKFFIAEYVMIHAQERSTFKCINIIMQQSLLQLNYSVTFNSSTILITCYNLQIIL
jgi:hypothetical protein